MKTTVRQIFGLFWVDFNASNQFIATDISSTLNYVDLVQINKTKCNKHTEEIYVIYPGNTACLSSSNSTKGFCYVSYLRSKKSTKRERDCFMSRLSYNFTCALSALKQVYLQGDIGGPVIYTYSGDSTPTVVGINSQHQGCPSEYPMAYTKIQPYLPWIKRIVPDLLL